MSLRLPTLAELQETLDCLTGGGVRFEALDMDKRLEIAKLAVNADKCELLAQIAEDTERMGEWFKNSRLWEGRLD